MMACAMGCSSAHSPLMCSTLPYIISFHFEKDNKKVLKKVPFFPVRRFEKEKFKHERLEHLPPTGSRLRRRDYSHL